MIGFVKRRVHLLGVLLWVGPGAVVSYALRGSIPWVAFMSWYAIVVSHAVGAVAERSRDLADPKVETDA